MSVCVCVSRGGPSDSRDSAMTSSRTAPRAGSSARSQSVSLSVSLDQVVFLQIELKDGVLDGGEHEADVLRI